MKNLPSYRKILSIGFSLGLLLSLLVATASASFAQTPDLIRFHKYNGRTYMVDTAGWVMSRSDIKIRLASLPDSQLKSEALDLVTRAQRMDRRQQVMTVPGWLLVGVGSSTLAAGQPDGGGTSLFGVGAVAGGLLVALPGTYIAHRVQRHTIRAAELYNDAVLLASYEPSYGEPPTDDEDLLPLTM